MSQAAARAAAAGVAAAPGDQQSDRPDDEEEGGVEGGTVFGAEGGAAAADALQAAPDADADGDAGGGGADGSTLKCYGMEDNIWHSCARPPHRPRPPPSPPYRHPGAEPRGKATLPPAVEFWVKDGYGGKTLRLPCVAVSAAVAKMGPCPCGRPVTDDLACRPRGSFRCQQRAPVAAAPGVRGRFPAYLFLKNEGWKGGLAGLFQEAAPVGDRCAR